MGRAWRIEYEGALYRMLSRGNEQKDIFYSELGTTAPDAILQHTKTFWGETDEIQKHITFRWWRLYRYGPRSTSL
jgi:hypothetical protein